MIEIERKFTVKDLSFKKYAYEVRHITQGILNNEDKNEIRISIRDNYAWICVKNRCSKIDRFEWLHEIPIDEAKLLLKNCALGTIINKTRYLIKSKESLTWEVDEFLDDNEGLIIAEIEIPSIDYNIELPEWINTEVTGDKRYYNYTLSFVPWKQQMKYEEDWSEVTKSFNNAYN